MDGKVFYVDKRSETSADTLLAIGFASLLGDIFRELYGTVDDILIQDAGPYYTISLPNSIGVNDLPKSLDLPMLLPLSNSKLREKEEKQGKTLDGFNYDEQMERSRAYREQVKKLPAEFQTPDARVKRAPELLEIIGEEPDDTRLGHYQTISQMKIASSFNELAQRWTELTEEQKQLHVNLLLTLFSSPDNDLVEAIASWQKLAKEHNIRGNVLVTALQIINPTTGKGANRGKASELTIGNQDSFWLLELLKFKGFMDAAAPLVIKESKDRKTYVLQPKTIELSPLQTMMRDFRNVFWPTTAIKLDIMSSLRFAQVFVEQYKTLFQQNTRLKRWQSRPLVSIAQGFEVASYKDMGSAYATMNVAAINLPSWLPEMNSLDQVKEAESLLDEHIRLIQQIRNSKGEEGSEEFELLHLYRDFLSGHDLRPFWKFTAAYSSYLVSAREKNRYVQQLTTSGLEKLIMNSHNESTKLAEITNNEGFKHIAYAIRQSTVIAQYRRAQLKDPTIVTYEVRYGLGQELMREAGYREKFMVALCEFLQKYSAETAREEEKVANRLGRKLTLEDRRTYNLRANIANTDIDEIAALIDRFKSSELICSMLVAYGYARDSRKSSNEDIEDSSTKEIV